LSINPSAPNKRRADPRDLLSVNDHSSVFRPNRTYKWSSNVRLAPDLHKKAVLKSLMLGISLNQFVQRAIEKEVSTKPRAV
jgi:predicted HicB family RNase H-like nuclease